MTQYFIDQLESNADVFRALLKEPTREIYLWKPAPEKWNQLEILCHLYDEEREDFRARVKHILETPDQPMPSINPVEWVTERKYAEQNYSEMLDKFLNERKQSVNWLNGLVEPKWSNVYQHPKVGPISARLILNNWLAHDYLHFRQITRTKYQYLQQHISTPLDYAGEW